MIDFSNVENIAIPEGEVSVIARGDEVLWRKKKFKKELEYLESTGTQWIDASYNPNTNTAIEMLCSGITANGFSVASGTWFFGARRGYLDNAFGSYYNPSARCLYYAFGEQMPLKTITTLYNSNQKFYADSSGLRINDSITVSVTLETFSSPVSLSLFGLNNNGSTISTTAYRMHYFKIWDNGALARDFVPVLDWDDRPCMYDKVADELFYNKGTGEFLYA